MHMGPAKLAVLFFISTVTTSLAVTSQAAYSDNFSGGTGAQADCGASVNMADNNDHSYYYDELASETAAAVNWSRINNLDPTRIDTSVTGSLTALTDVVVYDRYYGDFCGQSWWSPSNGSGTVGLVACEGLVGVGNPRCEQHSFRVSNSFIDAKLTYDERSLACHENGHTLGLTHRSGSCMVTGYPKPAATYDAHNNSHLNTSY